MNTTKQRGFTIIEVVLVLAIAGLIFLMVFIALPALQRGQRDTQRKGDLSRFTAQINSYQSNNKGTIPANTSLNGATGFVSTYLKAGGDTFMDPNGGDYTVVGTSGAAPAYDTANKKAVVYYSVKARCGANGKVDFSTANGDRQYAVSISLEGGGAYCQQN